MSSSLTILAAQAQAAQESRARQKQYEAAATEEAQRRIAVARQSEICADLFGARTASQLGVTFPWDARSHRALGIGTFDGGVERVMFYDGPQHRFQIGDPHDPDRIPIAYDGPCPRPEQEQTEDVQRERAERLILALAASCAFASDDGDAAE